MIRTRLCELFGIEHPIINAPMAGAATGELAAAVSAAGGLGMIGASMSGGPEWLRGQIRLVRERTDRPFGVGFVSSAPDTAELLAVAIAERVPAISHSFVDPTPYVAPAHAAGIKVLAQVQTVAQAATAARAGVDVIAAQGTEAGGHTGSSSGSLPLIPATVAVAGAIPVVAAGGVGDGGALVSRDARQIALHASPQLSLGLGAGHAVARARLSQWPKGSLDAPVAHPPAPVPIPSDHEYGTAAIGALGHIGIVPCVRGRVRPARSCIPQTAAKRPPLLLVRRHGIRSARLTTRSRCGRPIPRSPRGGSAGSGQVARSGFARRGTAGTPTRSGRRADRRPP